MPQKFHFSPTKKLGQNFLIDHNAIHRVVQSVGNIQDCLILEIGPGTGNLTKELLAKGAQVLAIEKDKRLEPTLVDLVKKYPNQFHYILKDALKFTFEDLQAFLHFPSSPSLSLRPPPLSFLPSRESRLDPRVKPEDDNDRVYENKIIKIVSNLPYNIGTELLIYWLHNFLNIQNFTLMFQKEVGLRITAQPHSEHYGRLSILCQYLCHCEHLFDLPPQCFSPMPKVFSSVVQLHPKIINAHQKSLLPILEKLTQTVFSQRRKMLRSSLRQILSDTQITNLITFLNTKPEIRPEELDIKDFIKMAKFCKDLNQSL